MLFWNILVCFAIEILLPCIAATQPSVDETITLDLTTPSVTFTSLGFEQGSYQANTNYRWEIVAPEPQKISLTFQVFILEYHPKCIWDYVRLSDSNCLANHHGSSLQTFCGIKTSLEYKSTGSVMCVEFHSDIINQLKGFEAVAEIKEETASSVESTMQPSTTAKAPLLLSESTAESYYNSAISMKPSTTVDQSQAETIGNESQKSSHQTSGQFSTPVSQSQISSNLQTSTVSIQTSSISPVKTLSEPLTQSTDSTHKDIFTSTTFLSPKITSVDSLTSSLSTTNPPTSSSGKPGPVSRPTNDVTLSEGSMDPINVITYSEICIRTPKDGTGMYPVNFHSVLNIYNPENRKLTLTFDSFQVENSYYCSWDYLVIYTSQSSGPLCGHTVPQPIETNIEGIQLLFHSDLIVPDIGFVMRIKVDHPQILPQPLSPLPTKIFSNMYSSTLVPTTLLQSKMETTSLTSLFTTETSSPELTKDSISSSSAEYSTISTTMDSQSLPDSTVLQTTSQTLSISSTPTTPYVSSSVFSMQPSTLSSISPVETSSDYSPHSSKTLTSPATADPSHNSTSLLSTTVSKLFTTESSTSTTFWSPTPTSVTPLPEIDVCDFSDISVDAASEIIVKSPRDANGNYPLNIHCQMKIMNSQHKNLKVQFTEFRVEQNSFCFWDYLIIYTSAKHGPLCGYKLPPDLVTNSDEITLTFRSDAIIPDKGFVLHINVQQDSRNQSSTASTTPTETTTSNSLSSSEINKTTLNKQQTPTDPPVYNLTSDITKHQPSTSPLFIATGPSEKTKLRSNTSNTSPMIPVTNKSTWKISSPTAMKLSTPSSIKQSSHSSVTFIPTSASLSEVDDDSGLNLMTTNSREKTQPTTSPELYKELDICSQNSLEFEEKMSLTSPGFSNGLNYPLNIACNKTVKGVIGENITLTIEVFNVEKNSKCSWDFLNIHFKNQHVKLCGNIIPGQHLDNYVSCETGDFVQYNYSLESRICFLDKNLSHTFVFTTTETLLFRFRSDQIVTRKGFKILLQRTKASFITSTTRVFSYASTSEVQLSKFLTTPKTSKITTTIPKTSIVTPLASTPNPNVSAWPTFSTPGVPSDTSTSEVSKLISTANSITTPSSKPKLSSDQQPFHDGSGSNTFARTSPISSAMSSVSTSFPETMKPKHVTTTIKLSAATVVQTKGISSNMQTFTTNSSLTWTSLFNPTSLSSNKTSWRTTQFTSSASNFKSAGITSSLTTTTETETDTDSLGGQEITTTMSRLFSSKSPLISTTSYPFVTSTSGVSNQKTELTPRGSNETMTGQPITSPSSLAHKATSATFTLSNLTQSSHITQTSTLAFHTSPSPSSSIDTSLPSACLPGTEPYSLSADIGYIESPMIQNQSTYPPDVLCRWKINVLDGQFVSLVFEWFDLEQNNGCHLDKLSIYQTWLDDERQTLAVLCGNNLPDTITASGDVLIEFQSNTNGEKTGFRLKFIKIDKTDEDLTLNCPPGMTPCWASKICMPVEWICDGELNCPDMSDEAKCAVCGDNQFSCGGDTCIDRAKRCDGHNDCLYGLDEQDCVYLGDEGLVTIDVGGKPLPLCYSQTVLSNGNLLCHALLSRRANKVWSEYTGSVMVAGMAIMSVTEQALSLYTESTTCPSNAETRLECHNQECGLKSDHFRRKRIIGGTLSEDGSWPWTVALMAGTKMICAGTIISKEWVLTAGHCVQDLPKNPHIASIVAGVSDINDVNAQTRYVREVVMHPDYFSIFHADIALLKLDRPLNFNDNVKQICLPWDGREFSLSSKCFIAGWGISDMSEYYVAVTPKYLRHAKTKLVSWEYCNASYTTYSSMDNKIKKEMICAGYSSGAIDTCKGDSGGGLMCQVKDGRWVVAGVTSWGELCGITNKPGVYTKVAAYIQWINETLGVPGNENVTCTFETSEWCGYQALSSGKYIWTRKPAGKQVTGYILYAIRADSNLSNPENATLVTPRFNMGPQKCLSFQFLFSINSNITLSIYGITEDNVTMQENKSEGILLWHVTSHHPMKESWQTSEANVPENVTRLKFVSLHDRGIITGLGLDNVTLKLSSCSASDFMRCNFDNQTTCEYSNPTNTVFSKQWKIKLRNISESDYVLETGGNYSEFGYMAVSQFVSPALTSSFTSLPHCLTFSFHKEYSTPNELKVVTYSRIGQTLTNQKVFWNSIGSVIGQWNTVKVSIVRGSEYFDHIVFEVRRTALGDVLFMLDNISIYDGYCR